MDSEVAGMDGVREDVRSADGTPIATLTAGSGPPLLLVHGGLTGMSRWAPLWERLTPDFRVTAYDRRGRGTSGDGTDYDVRREYDDVRAVVRHMTGGTGRPVDVFGHSFGAICALGAAPTAPIRRLALYEPPGPPTVPAHWRTKLRTLLDTGQDTAALLTFLTDIVGLSTTQIIALKDAPGAQEAPKIASRTLLREAEAIAKLDLPELSRPVHQPVLLLHGTDSPPWADQVTRTLATSLPRAHVVPVPAAGHEGVYTAPTAVAAELRNHLLR